MDRRRRPRRRRRATPGNRDEQRQLLLELLLTPAGIAERERRLRRANPGARVLEDLSLSQLLRMFGDLAIGEGRYQALAVHEPEFARRARELGRLLIETAGVDEDEVRAAFDSPSDRHAVRTLSAMARRILEEYEEYGTDIF